MGKFSQQSEDWQDIYRTYDVICIHNRFRWYTNRWRWRT